MSFFFVVYVLDSTFLSICQGTVTFSPNCIAMLTLITRVASHKTLKGILHPNYLYAWQCKAAVVKPLIKGQCLGAYVLPHPSGIQNIPLHVLAAPDQTDPLGRHAHIMP